jgi:hypothetical protein
MPLRHPFWLLALVDRIMLQSRAIEYATVTARRRPSLGRDLCCRRQTEGARVGRFSSVTHNNVEIEIKNETVAS